MYSIFIMEEKAEKPSDKSSQGCLEQVAPSDLRRSDMAQQQEETYQIQEAQ